MANKVAGAQGMDVASAITPAMLPAVGFSRWSQLRQFVPVSRETWRKLVKDGRAPQPQRWTERCTVYSNEEVHRWMKDPAGYQARVSAA